MTIRRLDHVGVVVDDLEAATAFFTALGLEVRGTGSVEGPEVSNVVGLEGVHTEFAYLQTQDGHGALELIRFVSPPHAAGDRSAPANTPGLRHLAFEVDDIDAALRTTGAEIVGGPERFGSYRLCYVRGPEGIIVELAEKR
jgi:catechol 2,3-dioxygenase-like lactoylglutathione lyase family enzyme